METCVTGSLNLDVYPTFDDRDFDPIEVVEGLIGCWGHTVDELNEFPDDGLEKEEAYGYYPTPMPMGKEGTLYYKVYRIGRKDSSNNALVTLWGNLKEYDVEMINECLVPFFASLVTRLELCNVFVRGMAVEIRLEDMQLLITRDQKSNAVIVINSNKLLGREPVRSDQPQRKLTLIRNKE